MNSLFSIALLICLSVSQNIITDDQGNRVMGAGNVWKGSENSINGASNQVLGDQNKVQGQNNIISGSNNVVGQMSEEDLAALQKQMADRLQGRFGNIFGNFQHKQRKADPVKKEKQNEVKRQNVDIKQKQEQQIEQIQPKDNQKPVQELDEAIESTKVSQDVKIASKDGNTVIFRSYGNSDPHASKNWIQLSSLLGSQDHTILKRFRISPTRQNFFFSSVYRPMEDEQNKQKSLG